jgi:hypothetical protein
MILKFIGSRYLRRDKSSLLFKKNKKHQDKLVFLNKIGLNKILAVIKVLLITTEKYREL